MSIISKETWDNIPESERKKIMDGFNPDKNLDNEYAEGYYNAMRDIFGEEQLQPQPLTYEDVAMELFEYDGIDDNSHFAPVPCIGMKWDNKLQAIGRLLVVAKFLNKNWKPNWENSEKKWTFNLNHKGGIVVIFCHDYNSHIVYFRTEELAKQAVAILGEDTVRLALGDY